MKRRKIQYDPANDYYMRLEVNSKALSDEIQQAYRRKAKELHPDLNPQRREWATDQFQLLNEAYDVLSDPELRSQYDQQRYPHTTYQQTRKSGSHRSRSSGGQNWWDVPHAPQPGYHGVRSRPSGYRSPLSSPQYGAWLDKYKLGFLRPFYAPIADLFDSPYRYLLGILSLVLLGNMIFIIMDVSNRGNDPIVPDDQPESNISQAEGIVPTAIPLPTVTMVLDEVITLAENCNIVLRLERIEPLLQTIKLTAQANRANLRSSSVRFSRIVILDETRVQRIDEWQDAELIFQEELFAGAGTSDKPLFSVNMPSGRYLLVWTPILPDGTTPGVCQQIFSIAPE